MTNLSTNGQKAYESALRMHASEFAPPGPRPTPEDYAHITDATDPELQNLQGTGLGCEVAPEPLDAGAAQILERMQVTAHREFRIPVAGGDGA